RQGSELVRGAQFPAAADAGEADVGYEPGGAAGGTAGQDAAGVIPLHTAGRSARPFSRPSFDPLIFPDLPSQTLQILRTSPRHAALLLVAIRRAFSVPSACASSAPPGAHTALFPTDV